ncbi:hypothetical protein M595_0005 [Lyngbya aestuarii BL J]|uniref:Uncharacterized protein n=1 Tax=Lyngbya aestuarii BL J TaxID=1348334 RepID=U7QS99_9CYAN|nr:hypothetical protein [Lyngbya aestuarii]ERT09965.1 hypothetical protein M595_0005 [Lyngbya aestuarii BL J]
MQNVNVSGQNSSETTNAYSPSVPISLYREVTAELQTSKASINSLRTQNQQLVQQNQQLRRELENLTQAAIQLQQAINTAQKANQPELSQQKQQSHASLETSHFSSQQNTTSSNPTSFVELPMMTKAVTRSSPQNKNNNTQTNHPPIAPQSPASDLPDNPPFQREIPDQLFTEEPEGRRSPTSESQRVELNGFWLIVSIALIIIVAFGAGYWIFRPLLQQQQR